MNKIPVICRDKFDLENKMATHYVLSLFAANHSEYSFAPLKRD